MNVTTDQTAVAGAGEALLLSNRFLSRLTAAVAVFAALTVAVSMGGRALGEKIALAGHTESTETFDIVIGQDHLRLPANALRFEEQRRTGAAERADLYLMWPEMEGYSNARRIRFNDVTRAESLIFLQLSQSTMSRDMSGRLEPIYRPLFDGAPEAGPGGLLLNRMKDDAGYGGEVLLTAALADGSAYAVRCMLPETETLSTGADCQRDIHVGSDLSVLYRFSSRLLPHWQAMETAVRAYVESNLVRQGRMKPGKRPQ